MASYSSYPPCNYDVFLSFRGEDTRRTIVSHLYAALDGKGIITFKDDKGLEMGDHISKKLHQAIESSRLAIVVLSENYASSRWCLMELQLIMAFYELDKVKVFPIFYGVDPSQVRHQRGSFSLERYQGRETEDTVLGWKRALNLVASLSGVDSKHCADDAMMLKGIIEDISSQLSSIQPTTSLDDVFGVEAYIEQMKPLLNIEADHEVRMIGIWGMGGIGKTTIAKCLYERFGRQFPVHCFVEKVDQTCSQVDLRSVQERFLREILRIRQSYFRTVESGANLLRSRLKLLKVFVVLDGVEKVEQLHALAKDKRWFGPGSRIIITTRDKKVLDSCRVTTVHEVRCLEKDESLKMLKHFAFSGEAPPFDACEGLAIRASQLAQGLPSALVAFGLYLCGINSIEEWEDAVSTLETSPHPNIMNVLRSSYMNLDSRSKNMFLKISCLFNGDLLHGVSALLAETETRIKTLADKSLMQISSDGFIEMHSLIQQMAREIVQEESMYIPRQQKLLWDPLEGYEVLKSTTVNRKIEGMALHICEMPQKSSIHGITLYQMENLIFLKLFKHLDDTEPNLDLTTEGCNVPALKLLHWDAYQLTTFPRGLSLDWLVELRMRYSNLESLWDENNPLLKLRILDVTGSKYLKKLPSLSWAPMLEELIVKGCTRLEQFPETIGNLPSLQKLDVSQCYHFTNLQIIIGDLPTSQDNNPGGFRNVAVGFTDSKDPMNSLTDVTIQGKLNFWLSHLRGKADYFSFTTEQQIPNDLLNKANKEPEILSSFYGFKTLDIVRLSFEKESGSFKCYSFSKFLCLTELNLINLNIKTIPDDIALVQELQKLDLSGNSFTYLPLEMKSLSKLKSLRLCDCPNLRQVPTLTQLETLKLSDCIYLQSFLDRYSTEDDDQSTYQLRKLCVDNCKDVCHLPNIRSHNCTNLTYLDLSRNHFESLPASIQWLPLLETLCLNDCTKLRSLATFPANLTYLHASGCTSLETVDLPLSHSIKHFDLSYCPQLNDVEHLIDRFLGGKQNEEAPQRFACVPGKKMTLPQILQTSDSFVGFDACIIIACESTFRLKLSSSSYSCIEGDKGSYRINLKPDFVSLGLSSSNEAEAVSESEHHMFIFHVPGKNVDIHKFRVEPYLEFSDEFHFKPARIISSKARLMPQ